ncbi:hypothetical protein ACFLYB_02875 [Chloroflexota bacterium]
MKYLWFSRLYLVATAALVIGLTGFAGCAGNAEDDIFAPKFEELMAPPIEVSIDQIYAEYIADEAAADARYKGKRLLFYGVTVEEVSSIINVGNNEVFVYNSHIITDSVKFTPRYTVDLDNARVGFIVDVVGECRGLTWPIFREPLVLIGDCWINIIEGEIVEDWYPEY